MMTKLVIGVLLLFALAYVAHALIGVAANWYKQRQLLKLSMDSENIDLEKTIIQKTKENEKKRRVIKKGKI